MIQRKQTLYLLIAAALIVSTYFFELWSATANNVISSLKVSADLLCLIAMSSSVVLSFVTIFYFKNRQKQIGLALFSLLAIVSFIVVCVIKIMYLKREAVLNGATDAAYKLPILFPFAAMLLIVLAILAIRKDDKLVKSLDRLR
jgi:hypothetical protein